MCFAGSVGHTLLQALAAFESMLHIRKFPFYIGFFVVHRSIHTFTNLFVLLAILKAYSSTSASYLEMTISNTEE